MKKDIINKKIQALMRLYFAVSDESKSELAQDLDDRIQSRNVPVGTSDDLL